MTELLWVGTQKIEVQWHRAGSADHPCLVFLHEGLGCVKLWKDFPLKLSQKTGCSAFVFSRLGYGRSDPSSLPWKINFMHTQARIFLPAVLAAADIQDHILIGHSDGGSIGLIHGAGQRGPDQVRRGPPGLKALITEAAHVFCEPLTKDSIQQARHNYLHQELKKRLEKYHGPNTDTAFWGWNDIWLAPRFMTWNIEKFLKHIQVPVLAVQGRQDPYGTPAQLASLEAGIPDCEAVMIENCRHSPHHEQPEIALDLMADFIRTRVTGPA